MKVLYNGSLLEKEDVHIDIEDRSYQFGDGIYEVVSVYSGQLFKMKEHLKRLERSANELNIKLPFNIDEIELMLKELCSINNLTNGIVYFQISRGVASRAHNFPSPTSKPVLIAYTKEMVQPILQQEKGVTCILTKDIRWLRCDIKSLNLLGNVLAKQEAIEKGAYEAILVRDEIVTEGSSTNLFIVKENCLYTHPANNYILSGITRGIVFEICQHLNLDIKEEEYSVDELLNADEVFLTGTYTDIIPITTIGDTKINSGIPGSITRKVQKEFSSLITT